MTAHELVTIKDGTLTVHCHPGQGQAWESTRRIVAVIAGTQSGKSSWGPHWLYREIQRCGQGDYLVVTPTYPLLELKALPEFLRLFSQWMHAGTYTGSPSRQFRFSPVGCKRLWPKTYDPHGPDTRVIFGYASDPDSLEAATAKAAWLDEAGQRKFKLASWEAILRRLSIAQGRILITTTPYDLGWLKQTIWDKWKANDPDIDVIRFDSTENPKFPRAEFERARRDLPQWKFDLFYRAIFTRPGGLIYDSFNESVCKIPRFALPNSWPRYLGLDFGGVNTAGIFYAREPSGRLYAYREYHAGGRTAAEHAYYLRQGEPMIPICVGGSGSEGQWRQEFAAGGLVNHEMSPGLPVHEPDISDVEVGIDRVYGAHKRNEIFIFDDLSGYLEQKATYSRVINAAGETTSEIEDKDTYHFLDAERYIVSWIYGNQGSWGNL